MFRRYQQNETVKVVEVIREANAGVAKKIDITFDDNFKRPSFYTEE